MLDGAANQESQGGSERTSSCSETRCSSVARAPVPSGTDEVRLRSPGEPDDVRELLLRISREMVSAESLDRLLQTMADAALRIVPSADKCVIHLLDASETRLEAKVCSHPSSVRAELSGIPADAGIAGRALRERATICVDDTRLAPDFAPLRSRADLRSLLVAPLYVSDTSLGTLSLSSSRTAAFGHADRQHVRTLAAQASVAIQQASLLREAVMERGRSDAIIESIADGLVFLDGLGRIARINPASRRMLELVPGELDLPCEYGGESSCPARLRTLLDPASGEVVGPYVVELDLPSGAKATLRVNPCPLHAPGTGQVRVIHDVSPERAEKEARALFISQIAHELRTPLQHIMGFAGLLGDCGDLPPENYRRFLEHIQEETKHLARLVDDLVELSRIETGRFSVEMERVRVDELVENCISKLARRARLRDLSLSLEDAQHPLWVLADPLRLEQVLTNLVENAFKFVPPGGSIRVSVGYADEDAIVTVTDTGPGIPQRLCPTFSSSSTRFVRETGRRGRAWGWGCTSAARSSVRMAGAFGPKASWVWEALSHFGFLDCHARNPPSALCGRAPHEPCQITGFRPGFQRSFASNRRVGAGLPRPSRPDGEGRRGSPGAFSGWRPKNQ